MMFSSTMGISGLPHFSDSHQQRSTNVFFCFRFSLVLGYFKKWQKVTSTSRKLAKLFESTLR